MVKYREILRLTYLGISQENIAFSCGCARSTVQLIQKLAKSKGLEWPLPGEMDDAAIRAVLYRRRRPAMTGSSPSTTSGSSARWANPGSR